MKISLITIATLMTAVALYSSDGEIVLAYKNAMSDKDVITLDDFRKKCPDVIQYEGVFVLGGWIPLEWDATKDELPIAVIFNKKRSVVGYFKIQNKDKITDNMALNKAVNEIIIKDNYSIIVDNQVQWYKDHQWKMVSLK